MKNPSIRNHWTIAAALIALVAGMAPAAFAGDVAAGKTSYTINCFACHGETGKGDGPVGVALQPPPRDFSTGEFVFDTDGDGTKGSDADLTAVIKNGAMQYGGSPLMAPWATLSDEEVANLVAFVRSLKQ